MAGGFKEQQKTIDALAERMTDGFKRQEKITDDLAEKDDRWF